MPWACRPASLVEFDEKPCFKKKIKWSDAEAMVEWLPCRGLQFSPQHTESSQESMN